MAKDEKGVVGKTVDAMAKGAEKASSTLEKFALSTGRADEAQKKYTGSIEAAAQAAVNILTAPWQNMAKLIGTNVDAFKELNSTGMSFGNSMNNIRVSAAEMRMSLDEFTGFMQKNQKMFAGLGGTVGKSAEEFTKLGQMMTQSELGERMTQLGYGYQELNEVLAIQIGSSKTRAFADDAARNRAIEGAMKLAEEMDGLAKLTGVSRKEQEETRKKLQTDMALEAALRQETRNMSKEDAEKYRASVMDLIATTEATQGADAASSIKERVVTGGSLTSSGSMAYASMQGEAFQKQNEALDAIKRGDTSGAKKAKEDSDAAALKAQDNDANLSVARYGKGPAADVSKGVMTATQTQYEGTKALSESAEAKRLGITNDVNALMELQKTKIKEEQNARDGLTSAMITTGNRLSDANAAATKETLRGIGGGTKFDKDMQTASNKNSKPKEAEYQKKMDNIAGGAIQKSGDVAGEIVIGLDKIVDKLGPIVANLEKLGLKVDEIINKKNTPAAGSRDGGTLEKTGSPIEPMDALVKIHKGETVLSPEATKGLTAQLSESTKGMTQMSQASISKMLGQPLGSAPKSAGGAMPGIDINKILTDIKTTVSKVEISNWPKELKDIGKSPPVQTQPTAPATKPAEKPVEKPAAAPKPAADIVKEAVAAGEAVRTKLASETKGMNQQEAADHRQKRMEQLAKEKEEPAEVKTPNSSESYKINGKEVDKKQFDQHMENNPVLAKLMESAKANLAKVKSDAGGVSAMTPSIGGGSGGDPMAEAAAAMERMKAQQAQFNKDLEDAELERLMNQKANLEKTQGVANEELGIKQEAGKRELNWSNSVVLTTAGLNNKQREMHGELSKLTLEDSKAKLEANQKQKEETLAELRAIDHKANAIELQAKLENRALTESEQAQVKALDEEASAKSKARQKENAQMADENKVLERLIRDKTMAEKAGMEVSISENGKLVKVMEQNSKKIAQDMQEALPVKDIEKSKELLAERIALQNKAEEDAMAYEEAEIARADLAALTAKNELSGIMENVGDSFDEVMSDSVDEFGTKFDEVVGGQLLENMDLGEKSADNSTEKIMADIKDSLPTDEFAGLDELIGGQLLENQGPDEKSADNSTEKIMADLKDSLPTSGVDLEKMGGDMLANMGRDEKYSDTKEDPTARIKNEMQAESINKAKATKFSDISIDASGMPVIKSRAKEQLKKEDPKKEDASVDDAETAKFKRQAEAAKKAEEEKKKGEGGKEQKSNLDDVVKKLELLNTTMNTLIKKTEDISAKQIQATKGIASGNLFGAH